MQAITITASRTGASPRDIFAYVTAFAEQHRPRPGEPMVIVRDGTCSLSLGGEPQIVMSRREEGSVHLGWQRRPVLSETYAQPLFTKCLGAVYLPIGADRYVKLSAVLNDGLREKPFDLTKPFLRGTGEVQLRTSIVEIPELLGKPARRCAELANELVDQLAHDGKTLVLVSGRSGLIAETLVQTAAHAAGAKLDVLSLDASMNEILCKESDRLPAPWERPGVRFRELATLVQQRFKIDLWDYTGRVAFVDDQVQSGLKLRCVDQVLNDGGGLRAQAYVLAGRTNPHEPRVAEPHWLGSSEPFVVDYVESLVSLCDSGAIDFARAELDVVRRQAF